MKMLMTATIVLGVFAAQAQADEAKLTALTTSVSSTVISGSTSTTTAETLQLLADCCAMRSPILPSRLTPQNRNSIAYDSTREAQVHGTLVLGNAGYSLRYEDGRRVFPTGVGASSGVALSPSAVPEPTTFVLLSAGALALFAAKRRFS